MEQGHIAGAFLYDLSKACDCVSPEKLIGEVTYYGFDDLSCRLLGSYLTDRRQYVYLNGRTSDCEGVIGGVPQGSIIGPTLFLIYINDLLVIRACCSLLMTLPSLDPMPGRNCFSVAWGVHSLACSSGSQQMTSPLILTKRLRFCSPTETFNL